MTSTVSGALDGGGTGGLDTDFSDGDGGVNNIATLSFNNDSGTNTNGTVPGGGNGITIPLNDVLGGDSSAGLEIPGLDALGNNPGAPGAPGAPAVNGRNGTNGFGINGRNGSTSLAGITGGSRLRQLMAILADRAWLRFVQGNRLCLPSFAVMNVASWVRQSDQGALQQLINAYAADDVALPQWAGPAGGPLPGHRRAAARRRPHRRHDHLARQPNPASLVGGSIKSDSPP